MVNDAFDYPISSKLPEHIADGCILSDRHAAFMDSIEGQREPTGWSWWVLRLWPVAFVVVMLIVKLLGG